MSPTKKPNKRLEQGARSREEILDVASRLMAARGYDGTSIADIARESGLPNSSIYWHFSSKAGIVAAVMERGAERFFSDTAPTPLLDDDTPSTYLHRTLLADSEIYARHPEFWRLFVLLLLSNDNPEVSAIVRRVRKHGRDAIRRIVITAYGGQGDAATKAGDAVADFALAGFDGLFLAMQASTKAPRRQLIAQLADSLVELGDRVLRDV